MAGVAGAEIIREYLIMLHTKGHMDWFWDPNSLQIVTAATKLKDACSLEEKPWQTKMHITKQRHHFANEGPCGQSYGFPSSHVQMRELTVKKAEHQRTDAFELWCWRRLLRVPWTAQRLNQSVLKEINLNIHWRTDAEAPILWPPDVKSRQLQEACSDISIPSER